MPDRRELRAGRYHSRSAASTAPARKLFCNFRSPGEGSPGSRLTWSCSRERAESSEVIDECYTRMKGLVSNDRRRLPNYVLVNRGAAGLNLFIADKGGRPEREARFEAMHAS